MQKVILFLAAILSVCMSTSCSKDDDSSISLNEKEIALHVDGTQQIKATGDVSKWSSENDFIASVSESRKVATNHIGKSCIMTHFLDKNGVKEINYS